MIRKSALAAFALSVLTTTGLAAIATPASAAGLTVNPVAPTVHAELVQPVYHHHHHHRHDRWRRPPPPPPYYHHRRPPRMVCWQERVRYWDGYRWRRGYEERCRPRRRW
jgi:hypothetical protein